VPIDPYCSGLNPKRVHDAIYAERRHFPLRAKDRNVPGAETLPSTLMGLIRTEFENNNYLKGEAEEMTC